MNDENLIFGEDSGKVPLPDENTDTEAINKTSEDSAENKGGEAFIKQEVNETPEASEQTAPAKEIYHQSKNRKAKTATAKTVIKPEKISYTPSAGKNIPYSMAAVIIVLCVVLSSVTGAASSYLVYKHMPKTVTGSESTNSAGSTDSAAVFVPTQQSTSGAGAAAEQENLLETQEATTAKPLTKGDIYSKSVNSIYAVKSEYTKVYNTLLGQAETPMGSTGTGFAISDSGYIITNYHVIENGTKITITAYDGTEYPAKIVGSEPDNDVAVLKIDAKTIPVSFGSSSALNVGDDIMVIGNALGELSYTFTDGIISYLDRSVTIETGKTINMFQTNAAINAGNSGGPVYNMNGEVIGIASAKYASDSIEGLGFCIPIDDIEDMIVEIILYGYVQNKPLMGVSLQTVTASMSVRYRIPKGCYIVAVAKNSPATSAGLAAGDVITSINGEPALTWNEVEDILSTLTSGETVKITYSRDGVNNTADMTLGEYKPAPPRTSYTNVHDF